MQQEVGTRVGDRADEVRERTAGIVDEADEVEAGGGEEVGGEKRVEEKRVRF